MSVTSKITKTVVIETDYAAKLRSRQSVNTEMAEQRKLQEQLWPFVDPALKEKVIRTGQKSVMPQEKNICVIFTDLRGFTNLTLRTDVKELSNILNNYYDMVIDNVHQNNGMVDKLMGDGAMCLFGALGDDPNYIENGVKAAQEILRDFRGMLGSFRRHLALGIGVAAGPAVVGAFGNGNLLSFTALGQTVNLSARIQGLATGRDILCNKVIADKLGEKETKLKGEYELKGINKKSKVYYINY